MKKTQLQFFMEAQERTAVINRTFMTFVKNGMTREQLAKLIEMRPTLWGRFTHWLEQLPSGAELASTTVTQGAAQ